MAYAARPTSSARNQDCRSIGRVKSTATSPVRIRSLSAPLPHNPMAPSSPWESQMYEANWARS